MRPAHPPLGRTRGGPPAPHTTLTQSGAGGPPPFFSRIRRVRGQLAAAAAIIATLGAAGCGGDETLTAAQVREQGNAACLKLGQRLAKVDGDDLRQDPEGT